MSRRPATALAVLALLLAACSAGAKPASVAWRADITAARDEARASRKIIMIDVYTDWCGWCKTLDDETYVDATVVKRSASFIPVKINPEEGGTGASFLDAYEITGYPNILFVDPNGTLLDRIDGFLAAKPFAAELQRIYAEHGAEVAAGTYAAAAVTMAAPGGIAWVGVLDEARQLAFSQDKPMMIDVYTDWCGWCKTLDEETYTDPSVISASGDFVCLKINPENDARGAQFVNKYGVSGYPTILFVDPDGTLVSKISGYQAAEPFAGRMRLVTGSRTTVRTYLAEAKAGNYRNLVGLFDMLEGLERMGEAASVYDGVRAGSALTQAQEEHYALAIGQYFLGAEEYDKSLQYLQVAEKSTSGGQDVHTARCLHAIALFYTGGAATALAYLDDFIKDAAVTEAWKTDYRNLRHEIEAAGGGE